MIAIVNYGMGNLRSVEKALQRLGHEATVVEAPEQVERADRLILPGVGAFADAMANLRGLGLVEPIRGFAASGRPFLGICLYLDILEAGYDRMKPGSLVLAHNSVNAASKLHHYLAFVRDPSHFQASVNVVLDPEGLEVTVR